MKQTVFFQYSGKIVSILKKAITLNTCMQPFAPIIVQTIFSIMIRINPNVKNANVNVLKQMNNIPYFPPKIIYKRKTKLFYSQRKRFSQRRNV